MDRTWTIKDLLEWMLEHFTKKGIDAPRLTAEMLLSFVLEMERIELYTHFDMIIGKSQLEKLRGLTGRCLQNEPVQYLTGRCEFYSLSFKVGPDCLIPRPETELLVERAIEILRCRSGTQYICDLCTGCGCIAVAVAKNFPNAEIVATDICNSALSIAAENIAKHNLIRQIRLLQGDLFEPVIGQLDVKDFDIIVCNPPYVSIAEYEKLDAKVKNHEPKLALAGGPDGLDIYRRIAVQAPQYLKKEGILLLEIGFMQGPDVKKLLEETGSFSPIKIERDFNNNDRIVTALRK